MQQFTLSLKASLASEAQALEGKSGEVLCSLLQLSPSALLQCSCCSWERKIWRFGSTQLLSTGTGLPPSPCSAWAPTHPFGRVKAVVWDWTCFNSQSQSSLGRYLQENKLKFIFPVPETVWSSCWWVMLSFCASVHWPTPASPLVPYKHSWGQQGMIAPLFHRKATAAGGMETSLSSPFAGKVIWSLKLWTQPPLYICFTALTSKYLMSGVLV